MQMAIESPTTERAQAEQAEWTERVPPLENGDRLPPLELYKLGFGYYVLDGHHRVAAARLLDMIEIEAEVVEFVPIADPEAARTFAETVCLTAFWPVLSGQ